ncbi:RNAPII degradation factor [Dimargaris xerosporica]|nr:RNAPII degradation factor [Dimargaris xerosporica]
MADHKPTSHPAAKPRANPPRKAAGRRASHKPQNAGSDIEPVEVTELRNMYVDKLVTLNELFPNWTDEDLLFTLQEAYGDLEIAIDRISEGYVTHWGKVGGSRKPKRSQATAKPATRREPRAQTAPRAPRQDKPRTRGGTAKHAAPSTVMQAGKDGSKLPNAPSKSTPAESQPSTTGPSTQPSTATPASQQPPKMTWAKILGSKEPKKPASTAAPEQPLVPQPTTELTGWEATDDLADQEQREPGWGNESDPLKDGPAINISHKATEEWVKSLGKPEGAEPAAGAPETGGVAGPLVADDITVPESNGLNDSLEVMAESVVESTVDDNATAASAKDNAAPAQEPQSVAPTPQATGLDRPASPRHNVSTPPGFKRPASQQRRLRQDAPVVMPGGNATLASEGLDVQFGSLSLSSGISFGLGSGDARTEDHTTATNDLLKQSQAPGGKSAPHSQKPGPSTAPKTAAHPSAGPGAAANASTNVLNGFQSNDYGLYGAPESQKQPTAPGPNSYLNEAPSATPTAASNATLAGPPGLGGNFNARDAKPAGAADGTHAGAPGAIHGPGANAQGPFSNTFPQPGLQQPFQQAPYPGMPYYSYYYMPSGQYPNPAAFQQSGYGQPFMNKNMYPMYAGSHPSAGTKLNANTANSLSASGYPYGNINGPSNTSLPFANNASTLNNVPGYDDLGMGNFSHTSGIPQLQNILNSGGAGKGVNGPAGGSNNPNSGLKAGNQANAATPGASAASLTSSVPGQPGSQAHGQQTNQGMLSNMNYAGAPPMSYQQQNYPPFSHQQPQQPPFMPGQQLYTAQHHYGGPQQPNYGPVPHHPPPSYSGHHSAITQQQQQPQQQQQQQQPTQSQQHHHHGGNYGHSHSHQGHHYPSSQHSGGPSGAASQSSQYHGGVGATSSNVRAGQNYWQNQN